jgi:hypothetical protein
MPADDDRTDRKISYAEEFRRLGVIGPNEFICIAQDIPPYREIPVTE